MPPRDANGVTTARRRHRFAPMGAPLSTNPGKCLPRLPAIDRHEAVVTCLEQYSKARPGRRAPRSPRLRRLVPVVVAVAFMVGPALATTRSASADQVGSAQAQAAQIAAQIQAQGAQLATLSERYDQDKIRVQQP